MSPLSNHMLICNFSNYIQSRETSFLHLALWPEKLSIDLLVLLQGRLQLLPQSLRHT